MHSYYLFLSLFITFFNVTALSMEKAGENFDYSYPIKRVIGNFVLQKSNVKSNVGTSGMGTDAVRCLAILWHTAVFVLSRTIRSLFRLKPLLFLVF